VKSEKPTPINKSRKKNGKKKKMENVTIQSEGEKIFILKRGIQKKHAGPRNQEDVKLG